MWRKWTDRSPLCTVWLLPGWMRLASKRTWSCSSVADRNDLHHASEGAQGKLVWEGHANRSRGDGAIWVCIRDQLAGESSSLRRRTRPGAEQGRGRNRGIGDIDMGNVDIRRSGARTYRYAPHLEPNVQPLPPRISRSRVGHTI